MATPHLVFPIEERPLPRWNVTLRKDQSGWVELNGARSNPRAGVELSRLDRHFEV